MPEYTTHKPGTFCWADLVTPDPDKAKAFYGTLFGWTFRDESAGEGMIYTTILKNGKKVGGLAKQDNMPPHWNLYVCVENADATAAKVKEAGGKVLMEPLDVMESVGRMFVAAGPDGAAFSCWQPKDHRGAEVMFENGAMVWWELYSRDPEKSKAFYRQVFGWNGDTLHQMPAGHNYVLWKLDGKELGGMVPMNDPQWSDVPQHWAVYFAVDDVDAMHAQVKELGGEPLTDCMDIPGDVGRFAVVNDPLGAAFTIMKPIPPKA